MAKLKILVEPVWNRQPGESERAFSAFQRFLNLGQGRSSIDAYRQETGKKQARNTSGEWGAWVSDNRWYERALAYDNHELAQHQEGVDQETRANAVWWQRKKDAQPRKDWARAERAAEQASKILKFPVFRTWDEGSSKVFEPINDQQLRNAMAVIQMASQQAWAMIDRALPEPPPPADANDPLDQRDNETKAEWKARLREEGYGKGEKGKGSAPTGGS